MRSLLTEYVRGKKRTLKYEFAVLVLGVWIIYVIRVLLSSSPEWIAAQQGVLGVITLPVFAFVGAVVGLQIWQNQQPPPEPGYETGEPPSPSGPEDLARRVG